MTLLANYKHSILGDPIPGASEPGTCASPSATQQFFKRIEPKAEHSSALFFHPTFDHKTHGGLDDDDYVVSSGRSSSGSAHVLLHEFARKVPTSHPLFCANATSVAVSVPAN